MNRRLVELAFLLPLVGAFLLSPPAIVIIDAWARASGIPLFIIYVFGCWAALIVAGGILSVRLGRMEDVRRDAPRRFDAPD